MKSMYIIQMLKLKHFMATRATKIKKYIKQKLSESLSILTDCQLMTDVKY